MTALRLDHLQQREDHWAIVDLVGKAAHIRTVPVPDWVKAAIDGWLTAASITEGRVFRCVTRRGRVWGNAITEKVIWHVVKTAASSAGIAKLSVALHLTSGIRLQSVNLLYLTAGLDLGLGPFVVLNLWTK